MEDARQGYQLSVNIRGPQWGDLGRYFVGVCDHIGIMGKDQSKVRSNKHRIDMFI